MTDIVLDQGSSIVDYPEIKNKHAQVVMRDLGITYRRAEPRMIADCWHFYGCENVPATLPGYLRIMEKDQ